MMSNVAPFSTNSEISMLAPAKINLFLHITGRREDDYHEIESLFVRTDFGDEILVKSANEITLDIIGPFSDDLERFPVSSNLVMRAAKSLQKYKNIGTGAKITLIKNLPVASGIGGGSADAAATLLSLIELWNVAITSQELLALALDLGADVPACLQNNPQWVSGIGESCNAVNLNYQVAILLVNPLVNIPTENIFGAYSASGVSFSPPIVEKSDILSSLESLKLLTCNDLFNPAQEFSPIINQVISTLAGLPDHKIVRMSGSGATCFALFDSLSDAVKAEEIMRNLKPEWWIASGTIITD